MPPTTPPDFYGPSYLIDNVWVRRNDAPGFLNAQGQVYHAGAVRVGNGSQIYQNPCQIDGANTISVSMWVMVIKADFDAVQDVTTYFDFLNWGPRPQAVQFDPGGGGSQTFDATRDTTQPILRGGPSHVYVEASGNSIGAQIYDTNGLIVPPSRFVTRPGSFVLTQDFFGAFKWNWVRFSFNHFSPVKMFGTEFALPVQLADLPYAAPVFYSDMFMWNDQVINFDDPNVVTVFTHTDPSGVQHPNDPLGIVSNFPDPVIDFTGTAASGPRPFWFNQGSGGSFQTRGSVTTATPGP